MGHPDARGRQPPGQGPVGRPAEKEKGPGRRSPGARGRRPGPAGRALSAEEPLRQGEAGSRLRCSLHSSDPGSGTVRFHKTSIMKAIRQVQN